MNKYSVDYSYKEQAWGNVELEVDDRDQAEYEALNYIHDSNPLVSDVEITNIKEI